MPPNGSLNIDRRLNEEIRNWPLLVAGAVFLLCMAGGMFIAGASTHGHPLTEQMLVGTVTFAISYAVAVATMLSFIGLHPDALVVRDPHRRWVIPWHRVQAVSGVLGLEVEVKGQPRRLKCAAFQRSLLASMFGSPGARRAADS